MSSDLDFLGLVFDSIFSAQKQGRQRNGGVPEFNVFDKVAPGVAVAAEAALNAVHPYLAVPEAVSSNILKYAMIPYNVGKIKHDPNEPEPQLSKRFKVKNKSAYVLPPKQQIERDVQSLLQANPTLSRKEAYDNVINAYKSRGKFSLEFYANEPGIKAVTLNKVTDLLYNPDAFIDKLTADEFASRPPTWLKIMSGGSALAGAGLLIMRNKGRGASSGDAVFMASINEKHRKHLLASQGKLGQTISDEQMIKQSFSHALDMTVRADAPNFSDDQKIATKAVGLAVIDYAKQNNLDVADVFANWDTHSAGVLGLLPKSKVVKKYLPRSERKRVAKLADTSPDIFNSGASVWIADNTYGGISTRYVLNELHSYVKDGVSWRGMEFSGDHAYKSKVTQLIDKTSQHFIGAARSRGDYATADAYQKMREDAVYASVSLTRGEKLQWYWQKWNYYKNALGPSAGFGLLTGDFFNIVAGTALVVPFRKVEEQYVFTGIVDATTFRDYINNVGAGIPRELVQKYEAALNLRGNNIPQFIQQRGFLRDKLLVPTGLVKMEEVDGVMQVKESSFSLYNGVPLISKKANKMQKGAYIMGTLHPVQLFTALVDGSLGDRLMYIGMNFGNYKNYEDLSKLQRIFLRMGLSLNSSKFYLQYRKFANVIRLTTNMPFILMQRMQVWMEDMGKKALKKYVEWGYIKPTKAAGRIIKSGFAALGRTALGQRIMRTAAFQALKKVFEAVLGFLTTGASEIFFKLYDFINLITFGALDKAVFKTILYMFYALVSLMLLTNMGILSLVEGAGQSLQGHTAPLPQSGYKPLAEYGWGEDELDPNFVLTVASPGLQNTWQSSNFINGSTNLGFASGVAYGTNSCVLKGGAYTQMWGSGSSSYHQTTKALDIGGIPGGAPVYALISGTATCITSSTPGAVGHVICGGNNYAGDAVRLVGNLSGHKIEVYYLHMQCRQGGSWQVKEGEGIGVLVGPAQVRCNPEVARCAEGIVGNKCWTGVHLHIHWKVDGAYKGDSLFCTLQQNCNFIYASGVSGKMSVSCSGP